jgi:translation initiation factor eIF-2B subunit gamma
MIAGFSNDVKEGKRLLLLRDAELSTDMTFRKSLLQACPRLRLSTRLLDSHAYILNRTQVIPLLDANPALTSLREHVMPLIAKASWMKGLQEKANWKYDNLSGAEEDDDDGGEDADISKRLARLSKNTVLTRQIIERSSMQTSRSRHSWQSGIRCLTVVSRLHSSEEDGAALPRFVARANTVATYLECNRWLLKAALHSSPLSFALPIVTADQVDTSSTSGEPLQSASAQISPDSILGVGIKVGDRASIKRSVVGNKCEIGRGARLTGCILLDGSKVLEK